MNLKFKAMHGKTPFTNYQVLSASACQRKEKTLLCKIFTLELLNF